MPRRGLTRERVVALAARIADEQGADALDLTALAEAAGVRKPSLYKHVDGLPDLRAALAVQAYEALGEMLAAPGEVDPVEAIEGFAARWRAWALEHPGTYLLATRTHVGAAPEVAAAGAAVLELALARVGALGLEGSARVHAARSLRALVHGFVVLELGEGFGLDVAVDDSFAQAVRALVRGWTAR